MFSSKLKRSIATVAALACVLGAAGPASASSAQRFVESQYVPTSIGMDSETEFMDYVDDALVASLNATGLKYETEITDYAQRQTGSTDVLAVHAGGGWDPLGYQHDQNDLDSGGATN